MSNTKETLERLTKQMSQKNIRSQSADISDLLKVVHEFIAQKKIVEELDDQINQFANEISDLKRKLNDREIELSEKSSIRREINEAEHSLREARNARQKYNNMESEIRRLQNEVANLNSEIQRAA